VDVLVNNAGYGVYGPFVKTPLDDELGMLQLNMTALVVLTSCTCPRLVAAKKRQDPQRSVDGRVPAGSVDGALLRHQSLRAFLSEAIGNELEGTGVTVTALCPGRQRLDSRHAPKLEKSRLIKRMKVMDARTVAEAGYRGLMAGKPVVIPGLMNKLLAQSVRSVRESW